MPDKSGKRYYSECPKCGSGNRVSFASRLPYELGVSASPEDLMPEYREDCACRRCGHGWAQKRKGDYGEIIPKSQT